MPKTLPIRLCTAALLSLACLAAHAATPVDVQPWMGTPEGALMTRLETIVAECKRLYDRDTRYRNQEGPMEDRPATTKCLADGQATGKAQADLVAASSAFKLDVDTMFMKWSSWLASVSASGTTPTPVARRAYDFAADQLKGKLNAAKP